VRLMKRVLILGASTGGMIVANSLARELRREIVKGEVEISYLIRLVNIISRLDLFPTSFLHLTKKT
jgi:predicted alpha/beta-fold hydrolase